MVITALKPKKNSTTFFHVSMDGEYAFTAHIDVVAQYGLREGLEVDALKLQEILGEALLKKAKERALSLLSRRPYSASELVKKLSGDVPRETAEEAVRRMEELSLIDDRDYAARYASDLYQLGGKSLSHIRGALRGRGIDRDIIDEVLLPYEETDEVGQIERVIRKKYRTKLMRDPEAAVPKVVAALMRQGFSYGDVKTAVENYLEGEAALPVDLPEE